MYVSSTLQSAIQEKLALHLSFNAKLKISAISGGSINKTYCIDYGTRKIFCKLNSATKFPQLFAREKSGLELLDKQGVIKVPSIIDCFEEEGQQVLLLEWIEEGERTESFWKTFGQQLAALHQQTADDFGLDEDNYMGSIAQSNRHHQNWTPFFIEERLKPMVSKCYEKHLLNQTHLLQFDNLYKKIAPVFQDEKPALLHGDLWSGNFMCNRSGEPVLIDPAVYFGHRSVDLAMTTLFGGFHRSFYEAYNYHLPFPPDYKEQWTICNLYPLLIHLYLFGSSYRVQIDATLKQFS